MGRSARTRGDRVTGRISCIVRSYTSAPSAPRWPCDSAAGLGGAGASIRSSAQSVWHLCAYTQRPVRAQSFGLCELCRRPRAGPPAWESIDPRSPLSHCGYSPVLRALTAPGQAIASAVLLVSLDRIPPRRTLIPRFTSVRAIILQNLSTRFFPMSGAVPFNCRPARPFRAWAVSPFSMKFSRWLRRLQWLPPTHTFRHDQFIRIEQPPPASAIPAISRSFTIPVGTAPHPPLCLFLQIFDSPSLVPSIRLVRSPLLQWHRLPRELLRLRAVADGFGMACMEC